MLVYYLGLGTMWQCSVRPLLPLCGDLTTQQSNQKLSKNVPTVHAPCIRSPLLLSLPWPLQKSQTEPLQPWWRH